MDRLPGLHALFFGEGVDLNQQNILQLAVDIRDVRLKLVEIGQGLLDWGMDYYYDPNNSGNDAYLDLFCKYVIGLANAGFPDLALKILSQGISQIEQFRAKNGWLHAGVMYGNAGAISAIANDFDSSLLYFLKGARDDKVTANVPFRNSNGIRRMFDAYVKSGLVAWMVERASQIEATDEKAIRRMMTRLGRRGKVAYALLSSCSRLRRHLGEQESFPNFYSQFEILSGIRNCCAITESQIRSTRPELNDATTVQNRRLALGMNAGTGKIKDLYSALEILGKGRSDVIWFPSFHSKHAALRGSHNMKLAQALRSAAHNRGQCYAKSLVVLHQARNNAMHGMEADIPFIRNHAEKVVGHILHVLIHERELIPKTVTP